MNSCVLCSRRSIKRMLNNINSNWLYRFRCLLHFDILFICIKSMLSSFYFIFFFFSIKLHARLKSKSIELCSYHSIWISIHMPITIKTFNSNFILTGIYMASPLFCDIVKCYCDGQWIALKSSIQFVNHIVPFQQTAISLAENATHSNRLVFCAKYKKWEKRESTKWSSC